MDMFEAIKLRRSIRQYTDKPIPKEALEKIVDAARYAATAKNIQPWEFVVITRGGVLKAIAQLGENAKLLGSASTCIAVFCQDTKYYLEDGSAATQNILLAATSLGIASCWIAGDKKHYCAQVNELLGVPSTYKLVSLIALGYPQLQDSFMIKDKRPLEEVIHWEKF